MFAKGQSVTPVTRALARRRYALLRAYFGFRQRTRYLL